MSKYWTFTVAAVLSMATIGGAAEIEYSNAFYYYGDVRVPLTVVPDEMSVGQSGEMKLFNRATLHVDAGTVEIHATRLGANMWRLRFDPQGSACRSPGQ